MPSQDLILLQTKLHRPRLPRDLVTRTRLVDLLNHEMSRQIILVCAPAGFGKTTLVSNWLRFLSADPAAGAVHLPAVWLSLDQNDSDVNIFLRYLIASLRKIFENACQETLAMLQARNPVPHEVLYNTFINELVELPQEFILVLDDYHTIQDAQVHNLLGELVLHWPRPLHLVLISRISPPLPLSSLRGKGMLSEIRTRDLRFTPEETATYLNKTQFALMSQSALPMLEERFEGWPAGLHLAALSLRPSSSQEAVLSALSSSNPNITGYLLDEVLRHQLPAIRSFLLRTSILDRFCAPLCEAVTGEVDPAWNAGACLEWIERSEMFLLPLDDRREWYRYHHFFQELLQQRLSAEMAHEDVNKLHLRAAAWFEEQGLTDDALQHVLATGEIDRVVRLMISGLHEVVNREDRPTLERWLQLLPEEIVQRSPWLLLMKVWLLQLEWKLAKQARVLQGLQELLETGGGASLPADELQILLGNIAVFRGQHAYFSNQPVESISLCEEALARIPHSWTYLRGGAMHFLGMSMQASGQESAAERLLLDEYSSQAEKVNHYALRLLLGLCFIYHQSGKLERTRQIAELMRRGSSQRGLPFMNSWAEHFLGRVHYECNVLDIAAEHFAWIVDNRYTSQISAYRDAVAGLALIHQTNGESAAARQVIESISQYDLEQMGSEDNRTRSLRARLMLLQGDMEGASNWVDTFIDPPPDQPLLWLEEPQVTRARVLLARRKEADIKMALKILHTLYGIADRTHNTCYKIEIQALRAVALDAQGNTDEAIRILKQALELAQPGGFIRVFVDLGMPMRALLDQLGEQYLSLDLVGRILAAIPSEDDELLSRPTPTQTRRQPSLRYSALVEPLTPREFEVLTLLRGPSSIKEIAQQLHITHATAKRHTINLYAKLGANQRWEAVAKAEDLGILPPR